MSPSQPGLQSEEAYVEKQKRETETERDTDVFHRLASEREKKAGPGQPFRSGFLTSIIK